MATTTGSKRLLNISSDAMAASNSMTYGGLNVATEQYVSTQVSSLVSSAPGALDTLNELAAALGDDPNFATTITTSIGTKLDASVNPIKNATVSNDTITFTRADNTTFAVTTSDANTDTNYYLNGITRSGNTLTFSVSGTTNRTYTFGSAAWSATTAFDAAGSAGAVNTRIDDEIIPLINGKADAGHTHAYLPLAGGTVTGALTVSGSTTRGTYPDLSQYHTGADNIVLKGNASGISSIFFESEKDGTNINHPSDFGFIQYHAYGTSTSGESNELIIGVSNDADDHLILNAPNVNGLKFRTGVSATDYTVYHSGNLTLATLGYTGATNANYITNNNQLTNGAGYITGVAWNDITSKPSTFAPSAHTHAISEVDGLQNELDAMQPAGSYLLTTGKAADSDLLDGINSGSFLRSDATDYITNTLYFRGDIVGGDDGYRDHGVFGNYDSYKTDHIWSMGTSYRNHASGTNFGNLYGLAYKHTNNTTGGTMAGGHQMVWCTNGNPQSAMGDNIWTGGAVYASGGNSSNWNTAYGWGNHALAGYLTSIPSTYATDAEVNTAIATVTLASLGYTGATNANYITNNNQLTNGAGYLTSTNDRVYITDSRGAVRAPSYYNDRYAQWDFQNVADTGVGGDGWHALLTVSKWASFDPSHRQEQLIFSGDHLWRRTAVSDADWGDNKKIWDSGNLDAFVGATVSNDTITFTKASGGTVAVTTSDADTNTWRPIDDTPVNGVTTESISSNWAYDHVNASNPHGTTAADVGADPVGSAAAVDSRIDTDVLPAIPTNNNQLTNGAGYITSYVNTTYTAGSGLKLSGTTFRLNGGEIPAGVDLNTYRTTGIYAQNSNSDTTSGSNWPTNFAGILEVWNDDYGNGIHCTQRYSRYNTVDVYQRNYYNGTWTSWRNLTQDTNTTYSTSDFDAAGSADAVNSRIDTEVLPAIPTNNNQLTNGAGYITGVATYNGGTGDGLVPGHTIPVDIDQNYFLNGAGGWAIPPDTNTTYSAGTGLTLSGTSFSVTANTYAAASHTHTPSQVGLSNLSASGNNLAGNFTATGDITAFSDARVKENVETLPNALESVNQMRGVTYNKIGEEKQSVGVIAQELQEVLPQLVAENADGMLSVAYGNITAVLIEAVKELTAKVESLEEQLKNK